MISYADAAKAALSEEALSDLAGEFLSERLRFQMKKVLNDRQLNKKQKARIMGRIRKRRESLPNMPSSALKDLSAQQRQRAALRKQARYIYLSRAFLHNTPYLSVESHTRPGNEARLDEILNTIGSYNHQVIMNVHHWLNGDA